MSSPPLLLLLCALGLTACHGSKDGETDTTGDEGQDQDGDGYTADADCDDLDPMVNPGVDETCDGLDNNCDDQIDEGLQSTWYEDRDEDGFGDSDQVAETCWRPDGYVPTDGDCDDGDEAVYPGNDEICDGLDNDCDGDIDEGATQGDTQVWYADSDDDGYGDLDAAEELCGTPEGYSLLGTDCDDADPDVHPDAEELCNGADDDCDDVIDDDAVDAGSWYLDSDLDEYGDPSTATLSCEAPAGYVPDGTDCDDAQSDTNPGADEVCDERDNDCDGFVDDDALDASTWYTDGDDDNYGDEDAATRSCQAPEGTVAEGGDCDDGDGAVNPAASEVCNEVDDDCDGFVDDDAVDASTWYADVDSDTYGDAASTTAACSAPEGYVADHTDCDDSVDTVHPGADEYCNSVDDNCDSKVDNAAVDKTTWYKDADTDTYGDPSSSKKSCGTPRGYVTNASDCDDTDGDVNPDADEVCNGVDDDCNGLVDDGEGGDGDTFYADSDDDGWGDAGETVTACSAPSGYVAASGDCDDGDDGVYPGANEHCDGVDEDCDGSVDDSPVDGTTYYADADTDTYGDPSATKTACSKPTGYVTNKRDCDDTAASVHPAADETCNDVDDDCDGSVDESAVDRTTWYADTDGDTYGTSSTKTKACDAPTGYVADKTDCDDANASVYPGAEEVCDDLDNDCDGAVDDSPVDEADWYRDRDGDGWGDSSTSKAACDKPSGYVDASGDCQDRSSSIYPGADEVCEDGIDQNCDGEDAPCGLSGDVDLADADARLIGENAYDYAAYSLSDAGDVNADGYDDVVVGAYGDDTVGTYTGAAYVVLGPVSGDVDLADAEARLHGEAAKDKAGYAVDGGGDVDGDGYDDVLIGAIGEATAGTGAGASYLLYGPVSSSLALSVADAKVKGATSNDNMGSSLAAAGDLDDDGLADMLLAAYQGDDGGVSAGTVYIFYGDLSGTKSASAADAKLIGEGTLDFAGWSVDGDVDVDGDGVPDVAVGASGEDTVGTSAGAAYLVNGPVAGSVDLADADAAIRGTSAKDYLGASVALLGDTNGDGYGDFLAGAYGYDLGTASEIGAAYLFLGPVSGSLGASSADIQLTGEGSGDRAGWAVSSARDVDADGFDDLMVGSYRYDDGATYDSGAAYLLLGPVSGSSDLTSLAQARLIGEDVGDYVGADVSSGGDGNADGYADLLIGAWKNDVGAADAGLGYLMYGGALP